MAQRVPTPRAASGRILSDNVDERVRQGEEKRGDFFTKWSLRTDLDRDRTGDLTERLRRQVTNRFKLRHIHGTRLYNRTDGRRQVFYTNKPSPWFNNTEEAQRWLATQEARRLENGADGRGFDSAWAYEGEAEVEVKAIEDRNAPLLGNGRLPEWLRRLTQGGQIVSLDLYEDNLCVWRCIAVHNGCRPDRSTREATRLAKLHFNYAKTPKTFPKISLEALAAVERSMSKDTPVEDWLGIRVYEPIREEDESVTWVLKRAPPSALKNILTIGLFNDHAFLIKDITKLAKVFECKDCQQRFTQSVSLSRHASTCNQGITKIVCQGRKVEKPKSTYELAFYPEHTASKASLLWLENESQKRGVHIHHALCGHGGERWINEAPVDGYDPTTRTVFQFHGCIWHGCRACYPENRDGYPEGRESGKTIEQSYTATVQKVAELRRVGYNVVELWGCEAEQFENPQHPQTETKSYPHFIFFDFEAYVDGAKKASLTPMLKIENEHVPISVSLGDTLNRQPTHICERDP